jgi:type II secretory pathway component PulK
MRSKAQKLAGTKRRAMILIVVLVVVTMLTLAAYTYVSLMRSHRESSVQTNRQLQARLMVDSGTDYVRTFLMQNLDAQLQAGGRYNNPSFKQLPIINDLDPNFRGYATIVAPALDDEGNLAGIRYGLEDESGRINLNTLLLIEKQLAGGAAAGGGSATSGSGPASSAAAAAAGGSNPAGSNPAGGNAAGGNAAGGNAAAGTIAGGGNSAGGAAQQVAGMMQSGGLQGGGLQSAAAGALASGAMGDMTNPARSLLMALPGMDAAVADAILDWIDEDDEAREYGAESAYYSTLEPPYAPKNGPLDTVEELLRVRGVTPEMLFGTDANRNGQIDPNEIATGAQNVALGPSASMTTSGFGSNSTTNNAMSMPTGSLDRGWAAYLTLHSRERNLTPEGQPRIYLNNPDLQMLYDELAAVLPQEWATFIVAYRQGGPVSGGSTGTQPQTAAGQQIDFNLKAKANLSQVLDLVDAVTQVKFAGASQGILVKSPFTSDLGAMNVYMAQLMDYVTVNPAATVPGRININQAPASIIRGIPGMDSTVADQILSARTAEFETEKPNRRHETWLLTEAHVTLQQMRMLQPFITSGGHVYRAQVVGYFQSGEAAARSEVIFDATGHLPRVVLWRDMSHLGRGYALETLGVDYTEY